MRKTAIALAVATALPLAAAQWDGMSPAHAQHGNVTTGSFETAGGTKKAAGKRRTTNQGKPGRLKRQEIFRGRDPVQ